MLTLHYRGKFQAFFVHVLQTYCMTSPLIQVLSLVENLLSNLNAVISANESIQFITGNVIYNSAYTLKISTENHKGCLSSKLAFLENLFSSILCIQLASLHQPILKRVSNCFIFHPIFDTYVGLGYFQRKKWI